MTSEPIEQKPKPTIQYSTTTLQIANGLRAIADNAISQGVPIDLVAAAFQAVTIGLTNTANAVLLQASANQIAVASPGQIPNLRMHRNGE